ncbi:kinase-like domain-containing protein [Apodospora peruviana]|uniref:Kinase-like domain-containing protein n=1 Tax=Apodospora peruviana TaxID=516989 RepID=A0AAE0I137_9PEZI|nr:kinase-like domain-containing protein [Apodospora peruviana]
MAETTALNTAATPPHRVIKLKSDKLPPWLRLRIWTGQFVYHRKAGGGMGKIVRIPFGKVVKFNTTRNELDAIEYVRIHTTIPVPELYEVYEQPNGSITLVMEWLPGDGAEYAAMTPERVRVFGRQLSGYLQQLRSLEPPSPNFIGSVNGQGPLRDHRLGNIPFGPSHNIDDFHSYLRLGGPLEAWTGGPEVQAVHRRQDYKVKFTHADLNPTNIQYHNGRIVGIIDWETAGWYPEYWEYTKMHWLDRPPFQKFFDAVEGEGAIDKYHDELKAERDIWRLISMWRYDDYYGNPENAAAVVKGSGNRMDSSNEVDSGESIEATRPVECLTKEREVLKPHQGDVQGDVEPRNPERATSGLGG